MSNKKQGMNQYTKRRKGVEVQTISVGIQVMAEECGKTPTEKVVICTGKKVYSIKLPSTYKEKEL